LLHTDQAHIFKYNGQTIFATKDQAAASAECEEALAAVEAPKITFSNENIHDSEKLNIYFTEMECSSMLLRELMSSLQKLNPEVVSPFSFTSFSQTRRTTYDDEEVPPGAQKPENQTVLLERNRSIVNCLMSIGAGEELFDVQKAFSSQFETIITSKKAEHSRSRPGNLSQYRNEGRYFVKEIDKGREFFTTRYNWTILPRKLFIGLDHGHYVQTSPGVFKPVVDKKLFNFTDNERLTINITNTGQTPEGETQIAGSYRLMGFTVNLSQAHYVNYSRHFETPGDFETSYWVKTNDGTVSPASTEEIANILFKKDSEHKNQLANTLIFEKMEHEPALALEDGGRTSDEEDGEESPRASAAGGALVAAPQLGAPKVPNASAGSGSALHAAKSAGTVETGALGEGED
jgi:hypothetical protein